MHNYQKIATKLLQHQEDALSKLDKVDSLLLYHGMGSGKTLTALQASERLNTPATIIGPAALKSNFKKEKIKHKSKGKFKYHTYHKPPTKEDHKLLVFDEAHLMGRLDSQRSKYPDTYQGEKEIFMTGTPIRNRPSELIPLLRGLGIKVPRDAKTFKENFVKEIKVNPNIFASIFKGVKPGVIYRGKNLNYLENELEGKVHYYKPSSEGYPSTHESTIPVTMSKRQLTTYKEMLKKKPSLAYKVKHGLPPAKSEAGSMNAFLNASRQVSNTPRAYNASSKLKDAPKLNMATEEILKRIKKNPKYRGVTYSNYLESGVDAMSERLKKHKVPHTSFTGRLSDNDKQQVIKDFNKGKYKHLLISGAGAEGLDLKGVRLMQILEPHWHNSKLEQVKARAIRYKSHEHLDKKNRRVDIQKFISKVPPTRFLKRKLKSTDEYMYNLSAQKDELNNDFLQMLKSAR
jgi:SNF2 family DNA or RNA helicase